MTTEIRRTTCVLDCPDNCALEVQVSDGRIVAIGGGRDHPNTAGFICGKVGGYDKRLDHPDRLLWPERRVGPKGSGRYERISWDEAIEAIRERFALIRDGWGGEAILPFHYGGSNGLLSDGLIDTLFFARLGASRLEKTICAAPTTAVATGMYGKMPGVAFEDYVHAEAILVWGANPKASNIHLVPYLKEARNRGAFVAVVDPRRNFSEGEVDLHIPVLPGADLPVALALVHHWAESPYVRLSPLPGPGSRPRGRRGPDQPGPLQHPSGDGASHRDPRFGPGLTGILTSRRRCRLREHGTPAGPRVGIEAPGRGPTGWRSGWLWPCRS
jgi:anaerobic selenocysteine-containing dehydrogenase